MRESPARRAIVAQCSLLELSTQRAVLATPRHALAMVSGQSRLLAELLQSVLGRPIQVRITPTVATDEPAAPSTSPAADAAPSKGAPPVSVGPARAGANLRDHPLVLRAQELFPGARVVEVRDQPD